MSEDEKAVYPGISGLVQTIHKNLKKPFSNNRLIFKNGEFNISQKGIKKRKQQYLADIFTTMIDLKWRWTLTLFVATFIISWVFFAVIWWSIAFAHDDLSLTFHKNETECISGVDDFYSALLFSIETQHTIGKFIHTNTCT